MEGLQFANRDQIREELGLGRMYPSDKAVAEVRTIMETTGFKDRLLSLRTGAGRRMLKRDSSASLAQLQEHAAGPAGWVAHRSNNAFRRQNVLVRFEQQVDHKANHFAWRKVITCRLVGCFIEPPD